MLLYTYLSTFISVIALMATQAHATMKPSEIQSTCNGLATAAFGLKDLVLVINSTSNAGPMQVQFLLFYRLLVLASFSYQVTHRRVQNCGLTSGGGVKDVFEEFRDLFDNVLADIGLMTGSPKITLATDQQTTYEAFSNVCHISAGSLLQRASQNEGVKKDKQKRCSRDILKR